MKPRCNNCERAMKRPHERKGSKGSWNAIRRWWYCPRCDTMLRRVDMIKKEIRDYIDEAAALKFPTIGRIREEINAPYIDLDELEKEISRSKDKIRLSWVYSNYYQLKINTVHDPKWYCKICNHFQEVSDDLILGKIKDSSNILIPEHCDKEMKLAIINRAEFAESYNKNLLKIFDNDTINEEKLDYAGNTLLDMIFHDFISISFYKAKMTYLSIKNRYIEGLSETWGYQVVELFLKAFLAEEKSFSSFTDPALLTMSDYKVTNDTVDRLDGLFSDIQRYIAYKSPEKLLKYREIFWDIIILTKRWIESGIPHQIKYNYHPFQPHIL